MEIKIFETALNRGLEEIINEQTRNFCSSLRSQILNLIESKDEEKVIIKKIIELLDKNYNRSFYDPRGWQL